MKRFRLSTLMLLIVIAALTAALVISARREAELEARLAKSWPLFVQQQKRAVSMKKYYARVGAYKQATKAASHSKVAESLGKG